MKPDEIDQLIEVLKAYKDGKAIEFCKKNVVEKRWMPNLFPTFNFEHFNYRVKTEPREFWLVQREPCDRHTVYYNDPAEKYVNVIKVREVLDDD